MKTVFGVMCPSSLRLQCFNFYWEIQDLGDANPIERVILLVEDNQDDVLLIQRAFLRAGVSHPLHNVSSGQDAIGYFKGEPPYWDRMIYPLPALVLLDIKMPGMDGFEVLRWLRGQPDFANLCVVMLTSSDEIRDVNLAYSLGADSFLVKPLDFWNAAELSRSLQRVMAAKAHIRR